MEQMICCTSCGNSSKAGEWNMPLLPGQEECEATMRCPCCNAGPTAAQAEPPPAPKYVVLSAEEI